MASYFHADDSRATRVLVFLNCGIYLLGSLLLTPQGQMAVDLNFGLSAAGLRAGYYWQLVTHQFLHGGLLHLLMNMVGLWFAGRELERVVGTRLFLVVYFLGGIVGGLAQLIFVPTTPVLIGASGSVFAVLIAVTALFPNLPITALIFFVLPVRMRAKYLGIGIVVVSVIFWVSGVDPNVGHAAHLGGSLVGFLFARGFVRRERRRGRSWGTEEPIFSTVRRIGEVERRFDRGPGGGAVRFEVVPPVGESAVDRILEKVLREGIDSLTAQERAELEQARGRRVRRWR